MNEKNGTNVKGIIGLLLGIGAFVCIICSFFFPMTPLTGFGLGGHVSFYGTANNILVWVGIICGIAAIVFSIMARKTPDKKGPRTSGMVFGIIGIIIGLIAVLVIGMLSMMTEFVNTNGETGIIAEAIKDNEDLKKQLDDIIKSMKDSAGLASESSGNNSASENSKVSEAPAESNTASENSENTESRILTAD